jgi:bacteriorhodopsin
MRIYNVENEGKNVQVSLQIERNTIERVIVYAPHLQWILETPTSVENGCMSQSRGGPCWD